MRCLFGNGSGSGKEIGGGASSGGISGGNRACVCFPGLFVQNPGFLDTDTLSGISGMEHETGRDCFILPAKRLGTALLLVLLALSGAGMICLIVFAAGERTGGRDDPDGAVATLWNPGELLFFLAALVPQQAVLVPGYCMLLEWCLHKKAAVRRVDFHGGDWNRLCGRRVCQSIYFKSRDASVLGDRKMRNAKSRYGGTGISRTTIWYYLKTCRKIA